MIAKYEFKVTDPKTKNIQTYRLKIERDESCDIDPFECGNVFFHTLHKDYSGKYPTGYSKDAFAECSEVDDCVKILKKSGYSAAIVRAYIHSGISLTVVNANEYPFNDQWDSGTFGILFFKPGEFGRGRQQPKSIEAFVKSWEDIMAGNVYGFILERYDMETEWEETDSCWGFVGDDVEGILYHQPEDIKEALIQQHPKVFDTKKKAA